jgi:hypothetical protein
VCGYSVGWSVHVVDYRSNWDVRLVLLEVALSVLGVTVSFVLGILSFICV